MILCPEKPAVMKPQSIFIQGSSIATRIEIPNNNTIRKTIARIRPILVALGRSSSGNLLEEMEIKIILSMPSTISRKVSVNRLIQTAAEPKSGFTKSIISCIFVLEQVLRTWSFEGESSDLCLAYPGEGSPPPSPAVGNRRIIRHQDRH